MSEVVPSDMEGKTQLLYLFDQRKKGVDLFEAIERWAEAHPLPPNLYPSETECWAFLTALQTRGDLTASELRTLQFAVQELETKAKYTA